MKTKIKYRTTGGFATLVDWQPGNGTKYLLLITNLEGRNEEFCNKRVLTWINNRRSMEIPDHWQGTAGLVCGDPVYTRTRAGYIAQKMECNMTDALAISECLDEVL